MSLQESILHNFLSWKYSSSTSLLEIQKDCKVNDITSLKDRSMLLPIKQIRFLMLRSYSRLIQAIRLVVFFHHQVDYFKRVKDLLYSVVELKYSKFF